MTTRRIAFSLGFLMLAVTLASAQIGRRFPSEKRVVKDPVTRTMLTFLTSTPNGDRKIYQTHNQWTSDGKWLIFASNRVPGEAIAVNEESGEMVQVTEGGYTGMLNIARTSMKLYFMRDPSRRPGQPSGPQAPRGPQSMQIVEVDLEKLFADSKAGTLKGAEAYQRICGTTPRRSEPEAIWHSTEAPSNGRSSASDAKRLSGGCLKVQRSNRHSARGIWEPGRRASVR